LINLGFDGINKTNMLGFNLQQVCNQGKFVLTISL